MHNSSSILNPRLLAAVAALGHGQALVVVDPGFPIPDGPELIDLSLRAGLPSLGDVLGTVVAELSVESAVVAEELGSANPAVLSKILETLPLGLPLRVVSHEELKRMAALARTIVRTGDLTAYSNIILVGGVTF